MGCHLPVVNRRRFFLSVHPRPSVIIVAPLPLPSHHCIHPIISHGPHRPPQSRRSAPDDTCLVLIASSSFFFYFCPAPSLTLLFLISSTKEACCYQPSPPCLFYDFVPSLPRLQPVVVPSFSREAAGADSSQRCWLPSGDQYGPDGADNITAAAAAGVGRLDETK